MKIEDEKQQKEPKATWPMAYVIAAILLFALIFNLWLAFSSG